MTFLMVSINVAATTTTIITQKAIIIIAYFFSSCTVAVAVNASSPVVGSSRNKMLGSRISSIPISVLFLSPPLTPLMNSVPT